MWFFQKILMACWNSRQHIQKQHYEKLVLWKITSQYEWLYTRIALRALKVYYNDVGEEGGVALIFEKTQFFLNTLYILTA